MNAAAFRKTVAWSALLLGAAACRSASLPYPASESESGAPRPEAPQAPQAPATPKSIDLGSALRLAAGTHLDILEARARVREAEGRASAADGYLLPILSAGGLIAHTQGTVQNSIGDLQKANFNTVNALG